MMRNERSPSSSSGSSRKGKKSSDNKPKQPQRGLGVAQLEKIRLHSQMGAYNQLPQNPYQTNLNLQENFRGQAGYSMSVPPTSPFYDNSSSISSANSYGLLPNMMTGFNEMDRGNIRFGDSQSVRYNHANCMILESQPLAPNTTRHFLNNLEGEDSTQKKRKKDLNEFVGSSGQNSSGSSDSQELDLELRLSL